MSTDIWIRPAGEADIPKLEAWLTATEDNLFDKDILLYKSKIFFECAYNSRPIMYMPVQNVLFLDSIARNPEATELEMAKALELLVKCVIHTAQMEQYNETMFFCSDPRIMSFAERHGFEELMHDEKRGLKLFRLKVGPRCVSQPE